MVFTSNAVNVLFLCSGFDVTTDACCGLGDYKGFLMCFSPDMACTDASNHIWWDQFHPTDTVNAILADNVWNGLHTKMCYPMNLEDVVASHTKDWKEKLQQSP